MSTTLFPQSWFSFHSETESDPTHTLVCECAGLDPLDEEIGCIAVDDSAVIEACEKAKCSAPGCDENGNLDYGIVYAVLGGDGDYCRLVHVTEGVAVRL